MVTEIGFYLRYNTRGGDFDFLIRQGLWLDLWAWQGMVEPVTLFGGVFFGVCPVC
jgi:hypothetical protein